MLTGGKPNLVQKSVSAEAVQFRNDPFEGALAKKNTAQAQDLWQQSRFDRTHT